MTPSARTTIKGLLAGQTATYDPVTGCTVGGPPKVTTPGPEPAAFGTNGLVNATVQPDADVDALIAKAFGDDLPAADKDKLGTRAVVVVRDGRIIGERYADGFTKDTPQLGWSMTKSVASLVTGRLVQEGVGFRVDAACAQIASDPIAQRARLADVNRLARLVREQIHPGLLGQAGYLALEILDGHKLLWRALRPFIEPFIITQPLALTRRRPGSSRR